MEAKVTLTAQQASILTPRLVAAAARGRDVAGLIVAAPFLSEMPRQRLQEAGLSYLDLTGNVRIQLDRPAIYLESRGASKGPAPTQRGVRSLKGAKAARMERLAR